MTPIKEIDCPVFHGVPVLTFEMIRDVRGVPATLIFKSWMRGQTTAVGPGGVELVYWSDYDRWTRGLCDAELL
mgnify:FL=1